ncbi:hypothetical protein [Streptomyces montanus]|uniref:hypothetical protein n=1 Tax=Streptomyces montanus TaxID=2580423 RepID=UPI0014871C4A|nr:hypothetical protein [Streptomyces montanus]
MSQHCETALPYPRDTQPPHTVSPAWATSPSSAPKVSGQGPVAIVTVVFAAAVLLRLVGMPLEEELVLLAVTGLIASFVVAVGNGRVTARSLAKKVSKLVEDE